MPKRRLSKKLLDYGYFGCNGLIARQVGSRVASGTNNSGQVIFNTNQPIPQPIPQPQAPARIALQNRWEILKHVWRQHKLALLVNADLQASQLLYMLDNPGDSDAAWTAGGSTAATFVATALSAMPYGFVPQLIVAGASVSSLWAIFGTSPPDEKVPDVITLAFAGLSLGGGITFTSRVSGSSLGRREFRINRGFLQ